MDEERIKQVWGKVVVGAAKFQKAYSYAMLDYRSVFWVTMLLVVYGIVRIWV